MSKLPSRPYLKFRELKTGLHKTRGRFVPSPKLRAQGYKSFDLLLDGTPYTSAETKHLGFTAPLPCTRTGRPANVDECLAVADALLTLINGLTRTPKPDNTPRIKITRPTRAITLAALFEDYLHGEHFMRLAPKTRQDYKTRLRHTALYFTGKRPHDLDEQTIEDFFYHEKRARGHRSAFGEYQCLRLVLNWGLCTRIWKPYIPHLHWKKRIPAPPSRVRIITTAETNALIRAADDPISIYNELRLNGPERQLMGGKSVAMEPLVPIPSIADAIILANWTAARPTDTLLAQKSWITGKGDGQRLTYLPNKTAKRYKTRVCIPVLPQLASRLTDIHVRHLAKGWTAKPHLILSDIKGKPYLNAGATNNTLGKPFAKVRRLAAKLEPSVADVHFQDYRDTAITRLARAACDLYELKSWSGHKSIDSLTKVLDHYLDTEDGFADSAAKKLMAQYNAGG